MSVVTGGGKTIFALTCIERLKADSVLVVVPTQALLDQWWEESAAFFKLALDEIHVLTGRGRMKSGTVNLAVLNTASTLHSEGRSMPCFLIVDECHKAAAPKMRGVLDIPRLASLGLSATPERPYDEGLSEILVPALGPVIYQYTYQDALRDGVIVQFKLINVVFELEEERKIEYDKLTRAIARCIAKMGVESEQSVALMLKRARVLNLSINRIHIALSLIAKHKGQRILVFHEDIEACGLINEVLSSNGVRSAMYHSKMTLRERALTLSMYRSGRVDVLVTCRALDEGFNVPETEIGIIAASTATRRQRIQRLGRILRPSKGKDCAIVYTLVATDPEISRLQDEQSDLDGVAEVAWSRA